MEKLKMHSPDLVEENLNMLEALFPGCVIEDVNDDGIKRVVNFDQLRQEFSDHIVEGSRERYQLDWPGKRDSLLNANSPIAKSLRPVPDESVDFNTTRNLFIEGDSLDVLKLLQEAYLNRVKMIYIDPPYNTTKDFIYKDEYASNTGDYLRASTQVSDDGEKLVANTEANGRRHSDWLSMMYARLKLARNLLSDDGVIFISIDDNEVSNLRRICDEIFGEKNFLAQFVWNTEGNTDNQYVVKVNHEYVVAYYRNEAESGGAIGNVIDPNVPEDSNLRKGYADNNINKNNPENPPSIVELPVGFPCSQDSLFYEAKKVDEEFFEITGADKYISDVVKAKYGIENQSGLPVKLDDLVVENGRLTKPCRIYVGMANKNKLLEFIKNGCEEIQDEGVPLRFYLNRNAAVRYRRENPTPRNILSVLRNFGTTEKSKTYLKSMGIPFDYPKPVGLIEYLIKAGCPNDGVVLDFFGGSGTTAESLFTKNLADESNARFILVQIPDAITADNKSGKAAREFCSNLGVPGNLSEICKERIRRVGAQLAESNATISPSLDVGFRVFKVDTSNMKDVYYAPDGVSQDDLFDHVDNIKDGRTPEDLLFQVLLDWGVDLSLPIAQEAINGKQVFFVDENALAACFEKDIDEDFVKELAARKPLRAVFRDASFTNDSVKINVEQIFKLISPATDLRSL